MDRGGWLTKLSGTQPQQPTFGTTTRTLSAESSRQASEELKEATIIQTLSGTRQLVGRFSWLYLGLSVYVATGLEPSRSSRGWAVHRSAGTASPAPTPAGRQVAVFFSRARTDLPASRMVVPLDE